MKRLSQRFSRNWEETCNPLFVKKDEVNQKNEITVLPLECILHILKYRSSLNSLDHAIDRITKATSYRNGVLQENKKYANLPIHLKTCNSFNGRLLGKNGLLLREMSGECKTDVKLVKVAVSSEPCALEFASAELQDNESVLRSALLSTAYSSTPLAYTSKRLRNDPNLVKLAVSKNSHAFKFASKRLLQDKEFVLAVLSLSGDALEHALKRHKADKTMVSAAIGSQGRAIRFASQSLQQHRDLVLKAVKQSGYALQVVDIKFRDDREVVTEAVRSDSGAYLFVSARLKIDKSIALLAVKQNGMVIRWGSKEVCDDYEVMVEAVKNCTYAYRYASTRLKGMKQFTDACGRKENAAF